MQERKIEQGTGHTMLNSPIDCHMPSLSQILSPFSTFPLSDVCRYAPKRDTHAPEEERREERVCVCVCVCVCKRIS